MPKPINVAPLSQQLGGQNIVHEDNPTTTRGTAYYPSGALSAAVMYDLLGGTAVAGQSLRVVINAASDADAAGRLATAGAHIRLPYGKAVTIGATVADPITRIDWITSVAKSTETSLLQIIAAVQA